MKKRYFTILSFLFFIPFNGTSQVNLNNGLVAHYDFNGNANDKSGNDFHGATHGGVSLTVDRFNNSNSAYDFDGDDGYIDVPFTDSLNLTGDKSFSLWYYIGTGKIGPNSTLIHLKNKDHDAYPTYHIAQLDDITYGAHQHKVSFFFGKSLTNYTVNSKELYTNYTKQWVHIATSYSQSTGDIKLYFNGKLSDSTNVGNITSNSSNSGLQIGRITYSPTNDEKPSYFTGSIDEIRVYNRAINFQEVQALYNETNGNASVQNMVKTNIELYPNPATNSFTVPVTQESVVFIYDIKGSLLKSQIISTNDNNVDISTYSNGVYMVKLVQGNEVGFAKLLK